MKTDELVRLLASGATPVPGHAVARRLTLALGWGLAGALLIVLAVMGVRNDLAQESSRMMFWIKPAFAAALAWAALAVVARLGRPGMRVASLWLVLAAPVLLIWLLAAGVLVNAAPAEWSALVFGESWLVCPPNIALVSMPLLAALLWAMKGFAPTRLALAGAGAGLLAGAIGALVYALHCPESSAAFFAVWYVLGMLIPTALGAVLGPRLLRW